MAKLRISALEGAQSGKKLDAQFNPKEVGVDRSVPWRQRPHDTPGTLEFEQAEPAQMSFELMFDGFEASKSIQPRIDRLNQFSNVDEDLHRPPKVRVVWGSGAGVMPAFDGVIESVSVRYTMFAEDGTPVRATVDVRLKEAGKLSVAPQR